MTQKIIQDVNQFADVNIDCITRQLGEKYVVGDYMEYFDFTKTIKGAGILNSNLGLFNTSFSTVATYAQFLSEMSGYSGRLAVYNIQFNPGDAAFGVLASIPAGYADDTTRFRNAWGGGANVVAAGITTSYRYVAYEAGTGNIYVALPPGSTITITGTAILVEKVTEGLFNYFHQTSATATFALTGVMLNRWDGSYYLGYITNPSSYWASICTCFVNIDNVPLHNANYAYYAANNYPVELQRLNFFSTIFFHFPLVVGFGVNDARPGIVHFIGKRWQPLNIGTIPSNFINIVQL